MTPLVIDRPAGNAGLISQLTTAPPVLFTMISVIVVPLVKTWSEIGDKIGNGSLIVIVNVSLSDPPELFAYNVYVTAVV